MLRARRTQLITLSVPTHIVFCLTVRLPWWSFHCVLRPPSSQPGAGRWWWWSGRLVWALGTEAGTRQSVAVGLLRAGDRWESRNTESLSRSRCFLSPALSFFSAALSSSLWSPQHPYISSFLLISLNLFLFFSPSHNLSVSLHLLSSS